MLGLNPIAECKAISPQNRLSYSPRPSMNRMPEISYTY